MYGLVGEIQEHWFGSIVSIDLFYGLLGEKVCRIDAISFDGLETKKIFAHNSKINDSDYIHFRCRTAGFKTVVIFRSIIPFFSGRYQVQKLDQLAWLIHRMNQSSLIDSQEARSI